MALAGVGGRLHGVGFAAQYCKRETYRPARGEAGAGRGGGAGIVAKFSVWYTPMCANLDSRNICIRGMFSREGAITFHYERNTGSQYT